ncbi:1,4-dihydroxy-2-naphthoate polyprenyltransferase [Halobacterium yunchengense]|uniref:1,4-dihydroxy-2-naphthoate polyprenyltransferase n=1 Tax=Halobacterium yunchengense TaxID=3108497 RepID=UPI0030081BF8
MTETADVSRREAWLIAARPHTLPVAAAPILVAVGLAVRDGVFAPLPAFAAFVGAALIQVGTNFANDYYDAVQGADTEDREGFTRVTAGGLIEPAEVKRATYVTFAAAVLVGTYLVAVGGVPILVVGLVSVASGLAYTGGPYPLGYHGLGDVFVFVFFGVVAVTGAYYVQAVTVLASGFPVWPPAGTVTVASVAASLPVAAVATNVLVVNNVRDREEDATTGKRTLAVRFGYTFSRFQYAALFALAYAVPPWFFARTGDPLVFLPYLSLPLALSLTRTLCRRTDGDALNPALSRTGQLLALYAALFGLGLAL